jgi:hypothetical protein
LKIQHKKFWSNNTEKVVVSKCFNPTQQFCIQLKPKCCQINHNMFETKSEMFYSETNVFLLLRNEHRFALGYQRITTIAVITTVAATITVGGFVFRRLWMTFFSSMRIADPKRTRRGSAMRLSQKKSHPKTTKNGSAADPQNVVIICSFKNYKKVQPAY